VETNDQERLRTRELFSSKRLKRPKSGTNQVAKVIALGPLAFKKRDTLEPWPEGSWVQVGDFVRLPKWGGDRWEVPFGDPNEGETALFSVFNDHEVIAKVTGDPLKVRAFL
jgi:co-chaperonin GroES (HSP10)